MANMTPTNDKFDIDLSTDFNPECRNATERTRSDVTPKHRDVTPKGSKVPKSYHPSYNVHNNVIVGYDFNDIDLNGDDAVAAEELFKVRLILY